MSFYCNEFDEWVDPNPPVQVVNHDGFLVVRDDLLQYGSKVRFVDFLVKTLKQNHIIYGSCPATGYAQISLPVVASQYNKKVHLFMAQRNQDKLTPLQMKGIELGAIYHWVPNGMLNVTNARAREYVIEDKDNRILLPIGLEDPTVLLSIVKVCHTQIPFVPDEVWSVGSSGTLNRGLQLAYPSAVVHVVSVGHTMKEKELGRAIHHRSPYKFDKAVKKEDAPPYPSVPTYDAKVWRPMLDWYQTHKRPEKVLVWNVAA